MTDRKFTPPTEFPAEYVTSDGRKAVILGPVPDDEHPLAGYVLEQAGQNGDFCLNTWSAKGLSLSSMESVLDLHDLPKKQVRWANDYGDYFMGYWRTSRAAADKTAGADRIAVIRCEWTEGQPPQYFAEEV